MLHARISGMGCYVPQRVLTNQDLEKLVDTNDEWITSRTGIKERHIAAPDEATSDMAVKAARLALEQAQVDANEIDCVLMCTVTPDMFFPATAAVVQDRLGMRRAWGFDLIAACSGFVYGLTTAANFVHAGMHKKVLVVGADTMSRIIDYTDRSTCILFGDGAGAFVVEATEPGAGDFLGFYNEIDGSGEPFLNMPAGGSRLPASPDTVAKRQHYVKQDGSQVFKYAVRMMGESAAKALEQAGLTADQVKVFIPHQANRRIIEAAASRLGMPMDRVMVNIDRYGNTTAATIPLATRDAVETGVLQKGDIVLFAAVGAGYTVGANVWRWGI